MIIRTLDLHFTKLSNNEYITHIVFVADGFPYEVVVVAFTSAGKGAESDREVFFSRELSPIRSVDANSVMINQLTDTSINMTWERLSLREARGFPEYRATLSSTNNNRKKRQSLSDPLSIITTNTFAVFNDLTSGESYSAVVGVRSNGAEERTYNESDPFSGVTI